MPENTSADVDVVVVGLGPTGATLANLLGLCGLSVLVLEREAQIYPLPRAVHFDDEIMRVFQTIGITDALLSKLFVNRGMRFCSYEGQILLDWPRSQSITDNGWNASYRFHQPDLEAALRDALDRFPQIECKTQCSLERLVQIGKDDESVQVTYKDLQTEQVHMTCARYVVGCDGARSRVRSLLKTDMQALGFEQRWLVADLILLRPMPELGDHTLQFCDPDRPATYCRNPGNRRRWEFALSDSETDEQMSDPQKVWNLLSRWISPNDATLERSSVYRFKSEVAHHWRKGRVFLAGDAAHLTPPFMGQGMCAGIRDAANLAWKLALACCTGESTSILDTYQTERKPNVIQYIKKAVELGELINRIGAPVANSESQVSGAHHMKSIQSSLGSGLGADRDKCRGKQFPQYKLKNGQLVDDASGYRFLFLTAELDKTSAPLSPIVNDVCRISAAQEPAAMAILKKLAVKSVLVRPDRYILASDEYCFLNEVGSAKS